MARRVAGVVLIGALVACLPVSAHAAKKPRPDLVVTKGSVKPKDYFWRADNQEVRLAARTKNKGEAKAKASETWVVLRERTTDPIKYAVVGLDVPGLDSNRSDGGGAKADWQARPAPRAYDALICADYKKTIKESNEHNNCTKAGTVFIIVGSWEGTLSGDNAIETGVTEAWSSDAAGFDYKSKAGKGVFTYAFFGPLRYTISGTDSSGCSYSGEGTADLARPSQNGEPGRIMVDYDDGEYWGVQQLVDAEFPYAVTCGETPIRSMDR